MLHLHGIEKRFGPTQALRGVDLDLVPGQALALIGENGAGKSTLVKTLTGVHAPFSPTSASAWPGTRSRSMPRSASVGPKRFSMPRRCSISTSWRTSRRCSRRS
jgi:ABC-type multidrug transport system ATPase subunit